MIIFVISMAATAGLERQQYDKKIYTTEVQSVKILQMFWQPFQNLMWQNFVPVLVMKSQEFSKQFLFQNEPSNDKLFVFC